MRISVNSTRLFLVASQASGPYNHHRPMKSPAPRHAKRLKLLILSAKGGGTGCALRAFYIAEAFRKRGHKVTFIKPIPSLPLWFDMALSAFYYFFISFS